MQKTIQASLEFFKTVNDYSAEIDKHELVRNFAIKTPLSLTSITMLSMSDLNCNVKQTVFSFTNLDGKKKITVISPFDLSYLIFVWTATFEIETWYLVRVDKDSSEAAVFSRYVCSVSVVSCDLDLVPNVKVSYGGTG